MQLLILTSTDIDIENTKQKVEMVAEAQFGTDIRMFDGRDPEPENHVPTFFIHLWVSDAETYMYDMDEDCTFSKELEGIYPDESTIKPVKEKQDINLLLISALLQK